MSQTSASIRPLGDPPALKRPGRPAKQIIKLSPPSINHPGMRKKRIQSIDGFVNEHFHGDLHAFRKHYGLVMQKIERWIKHQALVSDNAVYLRKSRFNANMVAVFAANPGLNDVKPILLSPLLEDYIRFEHEGNMTQFALEHNSTQQQVHRWVKKAECLWALGEIYRKQESLIPVS